MSEMPAPLEMLLRQYTSGQNVLSPEMFQHFGGDDILKQLQKYDPNAKWTDLVGNDEGQQSGKRLDFDITKLPKAKMPSGKEHEFFGLANANHSAAGLRNPNAKWDDDLYGEVTDSKNVKKDIGFLDRAAPFIAAAISMGGPALGGMLAGAGIGGGAGFTSAVTGGASGLGAGSIPGALGAGSTMGLPDWLLKSIGKAPSYARKLANGSNPLSTLSPSQLMSLAQLFGK